MEVRFSTIAQLSLENIADHIDNNFGRMSSDFAVRKIVAFAMSLGLNPRLGMRAEEWSWRGEVRRVIYRQNSIYYLVRPDRIIIIVIWDGRQSVARLRQYINQFFQDFTSR